MEGDSKIKLSPSKIKTFESCSWLYHQKYSAKDFPNPSNDGASRGSVTHYVLECLARKSKKNREDYVSRIRAAGDPFVIPSVERLIRIHANELNVEDDENISMIKNFILVALENDFFCDGALEVLLEDKFVYEGKNYILNGICDKIAIYEDRVELRDFKTSKQKFNKEELAFNHQNIIYTLAVKKKYPNLPVSMVFQFLKFKRAPNQEAPLLSDAELAGAEAYLENIAEYLSDWTQEKAKANFAKDSIKNRFLCGKTPMDMNAAGTAPAFVCAAKYPRIYYVLKDESGKFIKSAFDKKELDKGLKEGYTIESKMYNGCEAWRHTFED